MKRINRSTTRTKRTDHEGTWAVSYGDMITLLLGFFVMYFSFDPPKKPESFLSASLMTAMTKLDNEDSAVKQASTVAESAPGDQEAAPAAGSTGETQLAAAAPDRASPAPTERSGGMVPSPPAGGSGGSSAQGEPSATQLAAKSFGGAPGEPDLEQSPSREQAGVAALTNRVMNFVESLMPKQHGDPGAGSANDTMLARTGSDGAASGDRAELTGASGSSIASSSSVGSLSQGVAAASSGDRPVADQARTQFTEIKALDAAAAKIGERVYIMFPNVSFFGSASTEITSEGRGVLERFSKVYLPFAGKTVINIVGFADERAVRPIHRFRDNLELSALRAVSAQRVLEDMGIPLNRTRLMGHGIKARLLPEEEAPDLPAKWALSRKIMLVIEPEGI